MSHYERVAAENAERLRRAREADFTDIQMGLLSTIERAPGEVPVNMGMGYPLELAKQISEEFAPLLMSGLVYTTPAKMLELSEEGQERLNKARELRRSRRDVEPSE